MRVENKVVIITGAGSGIGKETVLLFGKEGAKVVVADVNEKAGLKGPFNCIQAVVEAMTNHGTGEIINVSSIVG